MYSKFTVPIPKVPGKIVIKPQKNCKYVLFETGRTYLKDKHYTKVSRVLIGKLADEAEGLMYPNDRFPEFFPDEPLPPLRESAYRSPNLKLGAFLVIEKILKDLGLRKLLYRFFGDACGPFLDLVSCLVTEGNGSLPAYQGYAYDHPLFSKDMRIYKDREIQRLLNAIDEEQILSFLDAWNNEKNPGGQVWLSLDCACQNAEPGGPEFTEDGKPREDEDQAVPLFNLAVAFDRNNRLPLFYLEYPGRSADVSQCFFLLHESGAYDCETIGYVIDRGSFTKAQIRSFDENHCPFILMVKGSQPWISEIVRAQTDSFETDKKCLIKRFGLYGKTIKAGLWKGDRERCIHVYHDSSLKETERAEFLLPLERTQNFLDRLKGRKYDFRPDLQEYFDLSFAENGVFQGAVKKQAAIDERLSLCGYFCLITAEKMTAAEALALYKARDLDLRLFASDAFRSDPENVEEPGRLGQSSLLFAGFIALIVRNRIRTLLAKNLKLPGANPEGTDVIYFLQELERIELICLDSGRYRLHREVSARGREILGALGIDPEYVLKAATRIGNALLNSRTEEEPEDDEDEEDDEDFWF